MQTLSIETMSKVLTWMTHWYRPADPENNLNLTRIISLLHVFPSSTHNHAVISSYSFRNVSRISSPELCSVIWQPDVYKTFLDVMVHDDYILCRCRISLVEHLFSCLLSTLFWGPVPAIHKITVSLICLQ